MSVGTAIGRAVSASLPFHALRIRTRILLFLLISSGGILLIELAAFAVMHNSDYYFKRIQWAHRHLELIIELDLLANQYSGRLERLVLLGQTTAPELEESRAQLSSTLDKLEQVTKGEIAFVAEHGPFGGQVGGLESIHRLRSISRAKDDLIAQIAALFEAGKRDEAMRLYQNEIDEKLDDEFERVIKASAAAKNLEVAEAEREATDVRWWMAVLVGGASFFVLAICVLASYLLDRSIAPSVQRLKHGVLALSRGDLSHRIGDIGKDELGLLAKQFDAMASQLLAVQSNLEAQVHERTIELEEANRRLQELDKRRVQFLADISHELRTPLTVLRGEAQVALRDKGFSLRTGRDTLSRIVEQTRDMGRLVDELLFLGRSETGEVRFERARIDLRELVVETVREAEVLGRGKDVTIEPTIPKAAVFAEGDPQRLKQALMIGLDNAVKYSTPGGVVVTALVSSGGEAEISVRNRGAGIAAEDLPFVFERFYRGRGKAVQSPEGCGLGLPIAKWIVEKHGGSIQLTSEPRGVTTLRIRLPISLSSELGRPALDPSRLP